MLSVKSRLASAYARITLTRTTTAFFLFAFLHCFAQGIIQSFLFSLDAEYNALLSSVTAVAEIPRRNLTYFEGTSGDLRLYMCDNIPSVVSGLLNRDPCETIFASGVDSNGPLVAKHRQLITEDRFSKGLTISPIRDPITRNTTGVTLASGTNSLILSKQCTQTLFYPQQITRSSMREDLTFVFLQFWLFSISLVAVLNDSVPHTLAVLATRALVTAWSAFAVWRTPYIQEKLTEMIFEDGTPCAVDLWPEYWRVRAGYEIPDLILNLTALVIASYLSATLLRDYSAQSFQCVGAPQHITRINKFFMAVLAVLQLEAFVLIAAMGLWIDVLINTSIAQISSHTPAYKGCFIITTVVSHYHESCSSHGSRWDALQGWYAIRREMRVLMGVFLGISGLFLTLWSIMFYSIVYRWTFIEWPYLACFTVASLMLILASIVLGVVCRMNFGKGLKQYLHAEAALASSNFAPEVFAHDEEKGKMYDGLDVDEKVPATFEAPRTPPPPPAATWGRPVQYPQPIHVAFTQQLGSGHQVPYNVRC
ncbi:hypothetical protein DXG03_006470 [Asterophora parasitica]|uniref:Transmembrane protein n=1 Tax=Asterophora parasitica TaxID=117018 RepID=A0A9P7G5P1_9AGAR|nr:hypothetical protein DXG03_006470 [Asterophora parasitica]